jgi:hypothetical protein
MNTEAERRALTRFEERTRELGLHPDRSDLLVVFAGWRRLQIQLARVRRYLASDHQQPESDQSRADGNR